MKTKLLLVGFALVFVGYPLAADALPSWNDTAPKQAVTAFVEK